MKNNHPDAKATEKALEALFEKLKKSPSPTLAEAMAYATLGGGKRLRASLVLGSARLASSISGKNEGQPMNVAMAYECLHAYSLIHDDLPAMDDSDTRRGKPSCHRAFDDATAILAGDALQSLAFELLAGADTHPDSNIRTDLIVDLAEAAGVSGMAGGQMLDLEAEQVPFSLESIKDMQRLKTGALIKAATVSGGRVGGGDTDLLAALESYAQKIGLAFQIADDILDIASDKEQGKASTVIEMGLEDAKSEAMRLTTQANKILGEAVKESSSSSPALDYMLNLSRLMVSRDK